MRLSNRGVVAGAASLGLAATLLAHAVAGPSATSASPPAREPTGTPTTLAPTHPKSTPTTTPTAKAPGPRQATGTLQQYGYGEVSVTVHMRGSRITTVSVGTLQAAEQYSQQLAQEAIPTLRSEVLDAQSANIAAVSGATYLSDAYAASVQSALDQLKK